MLQDLTIVKLSDFFIRSFNIFITHVHVYLTGVNVLMTKYRLNITWMKAAFNGPHT